jgi:hypothetical protein
MKTLKEARSLGWHEPRPDEYGGEEVTLKGHRLVHDTERAVPATEWRRRG